MREKDIQSLFTKWVRQNYKESAAWELKVCKQGRALAYTAFQPQQIPSLLKAKHECIYKKLSDMDPSLKPFDALQICRSKAYVVVVWYKPYCLKEAVWLDIDAFVHEQETSQRKSLTQERARQIAEKVTILD